MLLKCCGHLALCAYKSGGGGSAGGGGGASSKVDYPSDYKHYLYSMMRNSTSDHELDPGISMFEAIESAWDHSPYEDAEAFDPSTDCDVNQDRYVDYDTHVRALNPTTDWQGFIDTVKAKYDSDLFNLDYITDLVTAFDERQATQSEQAIGRFAAGMADIGAENSTGFIFGMALLQHERIRETSRYQRELSAAIYKDRLTFIQSGSQDLARFLMHKLESERTTTAMQVEINRIKFVAEKEYLDKLADIDQLDACWNMTIFQHGANLLSSGQGAAASTLLDSRRDGMPGSTLGGALTGAASGAMAGLPFAGPTGGLSVLIGAGLGAWGGTQ